MSHREAPLSGRFILITRPAGQADDLAAQLSELGARVERRPTIAFEAPLDPAPARQAVADLAQYEWLVFTSPNGVRFFTDRYHKLQGSAGRPTARIAAVGPGTARALERAGFRVELIAAESHSEGLAEVLRQQRLSGARVLLVRPEVARDVLPRKLSKTGARVDSVAFYRTVASPQAGEVASMVAGDRFDVVVFTSPSTVRCLVRAAGPLTGALLEGLGRAKRVAIGGVTAAALDQEGVPADEVAEAPDDGAIVAAVVRLFGD